MVPTLVENSKFVYLFVNNYYDYMHTASKERIGAVCQKLYVTGPAKAGHVGTNYIPSLYRSYLSTGTEYLNSVICIKKPIKCLLHAKNCTAIAQWYKKLCVMEV